MERLTPFRRPVDPAQTKGESMGKFPDTSGTLREWRENPDLAHAALDEWWQAVTQAAYNLIDGFPTSIPRNTGWNSSMLCLYCDSETAIDPALLGAATEAVSPRIQPLHKADAVPDPTPAEIKVAVDRACPVRWRLEHVLRARMADAKAKRNGAEHRPNREAPLVATRKVRTDEPNTREIAAVRRCIRRPDDTFSTIKSRLQEAGEAIGSNKLHKILDRLRETGEYTAPRRTRRKSS